MSKKLTQLFDLKLFRRKEKISQAVISKRLKVSQGFYSRYEAGTESSADLDDLILQYYPEVKNYPLQKTDQVENKILELQEEVIRLLKENIELRKMIDKT